MKKREAELQVEALNYALCARVSRRALEREPKTLWRRRRTSGGAQAEQLEELALYARVQLDDFDRARHVLVARVQLRTTESRRANAKYSEVLKSRPEIRMEYF